MQEQVVIPFQPEWKEKLLNGEKTCTSRTKKYGKPNDWFEIFGNSFRIITIVRFPLEDIAKFLYDKEGCDSPDEFKEIWQGLHPRKGWIPEQVVFTHFFRRIVV